MPYFTPSSCGKAIAEAGGNFISFGIFSGDDPSASVLTFKVSGITKENVKKSLEKIVNNLQ
ncbi:MAG: hypothetical protein HYZ24_06720 [Chloroflexi bacterium]|nr:hypothetical protein [Chloroflexota bacterium]